MAIVLVFHPRPLEAQGGSYPQSCPTLLRPNFAGVFPFSYAGKQWSGLGNDGWNGQWRLRLGVVDGMKENEGYYWPDGDLSSWQIMSDDNDAVWRQAAILVDCWRYEWYVLGLLKVATEFHVLKYYGRVIEVQCLGLGGSGGGTLLEPRADEEVYAAEYDVYDPVGLSSTSGCVGGGDSGKQYEPGDLTGGETVDWKTGTGNGGSSACGMKAVVDYVCIDMWVDGIGWVEWDCGYVTTC